MVRIQTLFRHLRHCNKLKKLRSIHGQLTVVGFAAGDHSHVYTSLLFAITQLTDLTGSGNGDGEGEAYPVALFRRIAGPVSTFHYNLLIRAHFLLGRPIAAVSAFRRLRAAGLDPDSHTFPFVLCAAAVLPLFIASSLHSLSSKLGFLPSDPFVSNTLISVYSSSGCMPMAQSLFDECPSPDVIARNTLIDGYAKSGELSTARKVFDEMPVRDVVSWGTLLAGYAQGRRFADAMQLFDRMDVEPDDVALVSALSCCAGVGALERGMNIHEDILRTRGEERDLNVYLSTALVDMYAKCGRIVVARGIFERARERNVFTWNAIIVGAAVHGEGELAVGYFHRMVIAGARPDGVSFLGVLVGCSHAGLVGLARKLFEEMEVVYGVERELKHYGCMADLLGRSGMIGEAMEMVEGMPMEGDAYVWGGILGGCRIHGDVAVAEVAAGHLLEMNPGDSGIYSAMADLYASSGRWEDVARMRRVMDLKLVPKNVASSNISNIHDHRSNHHMTK